MIRHQKAFSIAVVACALLVSGACGAQAVKAPPLPPGSALVRVEPGLNPQERMRQERAHTAKMHGAAHSQEGPRGGHSRGYFYGEQVFFAKPRK